eukprot:TRINITY_DN84835_c0_g1_i1.p1 TRINITY_DN84835_c0_g1~~TRINITY_DN84835_c0_g1_i1.p1  ORF type:complete len:268 (+),score=56.42 TRINITY_DN84835_c0_g1_i1:86-889(+)
MARAYYRLGAGFAASLNVGVMGALGRYKRPTSCEENKDGLWRVSYVSTMRGDEKTADKNIHVVVEQALRNNQKMNISGHMCYDAAPKQVWQELEGRPEDVRTLWNRISKDGRHDILEDSVTVEQHVSQRRYPMGWGLKFSRFARENRPEDDDKGSGLIQLSYKSFMNDMNGEEKIVIDEIIPKAMLKNAKMDITGFLLYNDRTTACYQVLEGPREAVEKLWAQIKNDPRHKIIPASICRRGIPAREFPNWSMSLDTVGQPNWSAAAY